MPPLAIRQPLASGGATLTRWARLGAALPGLVAVAFAVQCWREDAPILAAVGGLVGLVLLAGAGTALLLRGEPASDLLFEPEGLRFVGGRHHGRTVRWDALDPGGVALQAVALAQPGAELAAAAGELIEGVAGAEAMELSLRLQGGERLVLARGVDTDEVESLRALEEALREHLTPPAVVDDAPPTAVRCPACTAPARPSEEPCPACQYCGAPVPMPAPLRERLAAHRALAGARRDVEALVARLAHLPSARFARGVSLALFVGVTLLTLAGAAVFLTLILADATDAFALGALALSSGSLVALAWQLSARSVVDRQALAGVSAHFGARAPRREGEGWGCRSCGAPLPASDAPLLRCAYCDAESVPGLDARAALTPMKQRQALLAEELQRHQARREGATRGAAIAGGLGGLGGAFLIVLAGFGVETVALQRRCAAGDGEACYLVALGYFNGTTRADRPLALERAEQSCALGHLEGCCFVRDAVRFEWGTPRDLPAVERRLEAAEAALHRPACPE